MSDDNVGSVLRCPRERDEQPLPCMKIIKEEAGIGERASGRSIGEGNERRQHRLESNQADRTSGMRCLPADRSAWCGQASKNISGNRAVEVGWRQKFVGPRPVADDLGYLTDPRENDINNLAFRYASEFAGGFQRQNLVIAAPRYLQAIASAECAKSSCESGFYSKKGFPLGRHGLKKASEMVQIEFRNVIERSNEFGFLSDRNTGDRLGKKVILIERRLGIAKALL